MIAAILGGGLEAFAIKIPLLDSRNRQLALGGFGLLLIFASIALPIAKPAVISGKIFDVTSNQGISGVRITLLDSIDGVIEKDIFITAQDGAYHFGLPSGIGKKRLPLHFKLDRSRWAASVVPEERIVDLSSDRQVNLPIDLANVSPADISPITASKHPATTTKAPTAPTRPRMGRVSPSSLSFPLDSKENRKTLIQTGTFRLLVGGSPPYLDFELHVRPTDSPSLNFDVNKNDAIDKDIDVSYGLTNDNGACTFYRITVNLSTPCGAFHSDSTVVIRSSTEEGTAMKVIVWHILRSEINAANGDAHLQVSVYNTMTKTWSYFPSADFSQTLRTQ